MSRQPSMLKGFTIKTRGQIDEDRFTQAWVDIITEAIIRPALEREEREVDEAFEAALRQG